MNDCDYMQRCIDLALLGKGMVAPNPMVGCVIVHNDRIISEAFHMHFGNSHAENSAIELVEDKSLLAESTVYISLEPCAHFGKTPPCVDLLIKHHVKKVVVGSRDTNPLVSGKELTN